MRIVLAVVMIGVCAMIASGQTAVSTAITVPPSSVAHPGDAGVRAHTNVRYITLGASGTPQTSGPPYPGYFYETPASLACIYGFQPALAGCNSNIVTANPIGGSRAVAIVDAYDYSAAVSDLTVFVTQFGVEPITPSSFQVVYAPYGGSTPGSCIGPATQPSSAAGTGWDLEESLDIEYAHSMAPQAQLYLVEAQSDYFTDLLCAVSVASNLVAKARGGQVSMSWGTPEPACFGKLSCVLPQTSMDPVFTVREVVYFAGAGDSPGAYWPSTSPNVVSAGGTTLSTNATTGAFEVETTWQDGGGGPSTVESRPAYQNGIAFIVGSQRGTPDIAAVANPHTGVWVYNSTYFGVPTWFIVGGASLSTPVNAGIRNAEGSFAASSYAWLSKLYADPVALTDITLGNCGLYIGYFAKSGWDFCTGWGSPLGSFGH